ncbi:hypothetical protein [Nonomuraea turcica]|uniref:hypothetical protein n=1 Tax=Nonomuraea sp. G32 TaxID=3067274 RepID=UPI00273AD2D6|nr:hypothetical protein [Nonomuraea sp. G32]MDP4501086.1 hypothetical protein [Nonomuraea sp. G32]
MSDPFDGAVTARDVYGKVVEVAERVAQIDAKVDRVEQKVDGVVARVDDHEGRLRKLEAARWPHNKLTLLVAAAGLGVSILALIVGLIIKGVP